MCTKGPSLPKANPPPTEPMLPSICQRSSSKEESKSIISNFSTVQSFRSCNNLRSPNFFLHSYKRINDKNDNQQELESSLSQLIDEGRVGGYKQDHTTPTFPMRVRNRRIPGVSIPAPQNCLLSYQIQSTPYTKNIYILVSNFQMLET